MVPMKMTSISVFYIHITNYSTPSRSKSETVIKFKREKYEQKCKADYVSELKCILHDLPPRYQYSALWSRHDDIKNAKSSAAEISAANIHKNLLKLREKAYLCKKHVLTINDPHDYA